MTATRKLVLGVLFLAAVFLTWQAITNNRERRELNAEERAVEIQLDTQRAVARDLPELRRTLDTVKVELAEARRRSTPDLKLLGEHLLPHGVVLSAGEPSDDLLPFTLSGGKSSTVAAALGELEQVGHQIEALRVEVGEEGWTADLVARRYVLPPPAPKTPQEVSVPWYGFINDRQRERIAEKRAELAAVEQSIGEVVELPALQDELDARLAMFDVPAADRIDLLSLAHRLFDPADRVFYTGRLERARGSARGGLIGRLARPLEDPELIELLGEDLDARVVRRYMDTVEIAFQEK